MNIYLDHAATSPLKSEVLEAMLPVLKENYGNPDSLHAYGRRAAHFVMEARDEIAALLGVSPSEVYFTAGGTEADNWAMRGMGTGAVVVSAIEHAAVLSAAQLREGGHRICPVGMDGIVSSTALETTMSEDVGLVSIMAANNETGSIQPVKELAVLAHAHGAFFFSDCVQAICSQDLKPITAACDGISLSAHKLGGPKGVGLLVVKKGVPIKPLIVGGEQERRLRGGTLNVAGIVGLAQALKVAVCERETFCAHTGRIRDLFEKIVASSLGHGVHVDGENRVPNISHLTFSKGGEALLNLLDLKGVAASGGAACSAHAQEPSHVLMAMGRTAEEAKRGVRFSFGLDTTEEEVRFAAATVVDCLNCF